MKIKPRSIPLAVLFATAVFSAPGFANNSAAQDSSAASAVSASSSSAADEQLKQARALLKGDGVPKDVKKSFAMVKELADQGHVEAIGGLGFFYANGIAVPKDDRIAAEWFRKGAEKGSAKAQLNLGKYLVDGKTGGDDTAKSQLEGIGWIRKAAESGLPEASQSYGILLYFGDKGLDRDYARAAEFLRPAAAANLPEANNLLGNMHELGLGVPANQEEAMRLYRIAAAQGYGPAQANLGRLIGPESGDRETRIESIAWLLAAYAQAEPTSEKLLAGATPGLKEGDLDAAKAKAEEFAKAARKK